MTKQDHHRLLALDGLRFFAAFFVALAHNLGKNGGEMVTPLRWVENLAGLGMSLFFVLSGFVIHYHYRLLLAERSRMSIMKFLWLRFSRLYPLYIALIFVDIITSSKINLLIAGDTGVWEALFAHILMVQSWFYSTIGNNNLIYQFGAGPQVAWSVSTEMFFYIAYIPLSFVLAKVATSRNNIWIFSAIVCVVYYSGFVYISRHMPAIDAWAVKTYGPVADPVAMMQDSFTRWLTYFSPYIRLIEFVLGTIAACLYFTARQTKGSNFKVAALITLTFAAHFLIYGPYWKHFSLMVSSIYYAPLVAALIYMMAISTDRITGFLSSDFIVKLGQSSYSIYLLHQSVITLMKQGMTGTDLSDYVLQTVRLALVMVVILIISRGMYLIYELPAQQWLRKHQSRMSKVVGVTFAVMLAGLVYTINHTQPVAAATTSNGTIRVLAATYGKNCGAMTGNVTPLLSEACDGKAQCNYPLSVGVLGDPANGCGKDFETKWVCNGGDNTPHIARVEAEAGLGNKAVGLECKAAQPAKPEEKKAQPVKKK